MNESINTPGVTVGPGHEPRWIIEGLVWLAKEDALGAGINRVPKGTEVYMWEPVFPELKERQFRTVSHIDSASNHIRSAEKAVLHKYPLLYTSQRDWRFAGTRKLS
jgi:hypothetical protein